MINLSFPRPIFTVCILLLAFPIFSAGQAVSDQQLEAAISVLRNVKQDEMTDKQKEEKAKQIDEAWKVLNGAGENGSARLKQEIRKIESGKLKDDFFKLNAAAVLWQNGKAKEAESIARIWNSTPLFAQYNYVFYTAVEAAQTRQPAVLPILRAVLRDDKGHVYFWQHAMNVAWPLSHEFIWGSYGPDGLSTLNEILETSADPVELKSAMYLLARSQYLPSLPKIRQLAASKQDDVRRQAIQSLGIFGHPSDYDRLASGLSSTDPKELFAHAFALYEFEDERAVKELIPLLSNNDDQLKVEVSLALLHLLTPESLSAVKAFASKTTNPEIKELLSRSVTLREDKLPKDFDLKSKEEQAKLLSRLRNAEITIQSNGRPLTNGELLGDLRTWKEKGRIYGSGVDWVGVANVIAAAKPEDIELILSTRAAFYRRLSDECLYEVRDLDTAVKYIGRSRYRIGLGVTEKAELK